MLFWDVYFYPLYPLACFRAELRRNMAVQFWVAVMLITSVFGQDQSSSLPICFHNDSHTRIELSNSGVLSFTKFERQDIACTVNLVFDPLRTAQLNFRYETKGCERSCPELTKIEIGDFDICQILSTTSNVSIANLHSSGSLLIRIHGRNHPSLESFRLYYEIGEY